MIPKPSPNNKKHTDPYKELLIESPEISRLFWVMLR